MSNIYGENIKIAVFGQSHSSAIGVCVDGFPPGFKIDFGELYKFLRRRMPGQGKHTTARREEDIPEFLSGIVNGVTCGAAITAIIKNTDVKSSDYDNLRDIPRPSHADYTSYIKYGEFRDIRGGGQFSGRLTAPLCVAGGLFLQLLKQKNINISADIIQIGDYNNNILDAVEEARLDGDSIGGVIECVITGVPAGIGEPMFCGVENKIASVIFAIPAVKGIEFGNGFASAKLKGSENNDAFIIQNGEIKTRTNNHGGILGGITSGMPVIFRTAFKPTPSIAKEQDSVSLSKLEEVKLKIAGRHDPCIVMRAAPCVEAAAAIALADLML
ncbi:MAG: chorismate synthase [Oscillospiraceae bacterium]|nr:chorismate synthase [Oscillospiraceae bacterium]